MKLKVLVGSGDKIGMLTAPLLIGEVLYPSARLYAPKEEKRLSRAIGACWVEYRDKVKILWL